MSEVCNVEEKHDGPRLAAKSPENDLYLDLLKKCLCASIYDESAWSVVEGPSKADVNRWNPFKTILASAIRYFLYRLRRRSLLFVNYRPFNAEWRDQGRDWPLFGYTMTGRRRLDNVQFCTEDVLARGVPGDLIETGVWRGGSTILMRALLKQHGVTDRTVWCADSFEGLPVPSAIDIKTQAGRTADMSDIAYLAVSLEQVQANFARFGLLDDQVKFLKGWFCDSLPTAPVERIAVLRMDGDLYTSTMDALTNLYEKVSPGGYVIVDDYNSWPACKSAVDEYRQKHGIVAELVKIDAAAVYWQVP